MQSANQFVFRVDKQKHLASQKLINSLQIRANTNNQSNISLSQNFGQKKITQSSISIIQKSLPQQSLQCQFHQSKKVTIDFNKGLIFDNNSRNKNAQQCQEFSTLNSKNIGKINNFNHKNSFTENVSMNQTNYKIIW
ncbi:unnamed protein product (macronuclear) [Paramecium tetraurelia]|uniref:Uncharacterized protein n=1 Tax=Paramecium tetraurelia TaxID=5888 RepID=A0C4J9_PARTE|nr:uncharacterized protein GSPATT00006214001 [Paramecium tetraurelia]CAK65716.1 unnamed protein product [Paramecium tetraurelia]|eukprot:XP_001433113.1 hypothetical protein (macronuclear) [Paramecium tetraurelia strain d4-2]